MTAANGYVKVSFNISSQLDKKLREFVKKSGMSLTEIMNEAVKQWLESKK